MESEPAADSSRERGWSTRTREVFKTCNCCFLNKIYELKVVLWLIISLLSSCGCMIALYLNSLVNKNLMQFRQETSAMSSGDSAAQYHMPEFEKFCEYHRLAMGASGCEIFFAIVAIIFGCFWAKPIRKPQNQADRHRCSCHSNWQTYALVGLVSSVLLLQAFAVGPIFLIVVAKLKGEFYPDIGELMRNGAEINRRGMIGVENKYACCGVKAVTDGVPETICHQHTTEVPNCTKAVEEALLSSTDFIVLAVAAIIQLLLIIYFVISFPCCKTERPMAATEPELPFRTHEGSGRSRCDRGIDNGVVDEERAPFEMTPV